MRRRILPIVLAGVVSMAASATAHHSISASYSQEETVTIQGELVQITLRNPHSFMSVIVRDRGTDVRYAIEWNAAGDLDTQGVTRETLAIGDVIVISGSPSRTASDNRIRLTSLRRVRDGFSWQQPAGTRLLP